MDLKDVINSLCTTCERTIDYQVSGTMVVIKFYQGAHYIGQKMFPAGMSEAADEQAAMWVVGNLLPPELENKRPAAA